MITRATLSTIEQGLPKYRSMLAGNAAFSPTAFESIATTTITSGGTSAITFSSIPSTYKHLQLRWRAKDAYTTAADYVNIPITANGTNLWRYHYLNSSGSSISTTGGAGSAGILLYFAPNSHSSFANMFGVGIMDIIDYADTTINKVFRITNGIEVNTLNSLCRMTTQSLLRKDTSAISSLTFTADSTWAVGTSIALYGITG